MQPPKWKAGPDSFLLVLRSPPHPTGLQEPGVRVRASQGAGQGAKGDGQPQAPAPGLAPASTTKSRLPTGGVTSAAPLVTGSAPRWDAGAGAACPVRAAGSRGRRVTCLNTGVKAKGRGRRPGGAGRGAQCAESVGGLAWAQEDRLPGDCVLVGRALDQESYSPCRALAPALARPASCGSSPGLYFSFCKMELITPALPCPAGRCRERTSATGSDSSGNRGSPGPAALPPTSLPPRGDPSWTRVLRPRARRLGVAEPHACPPPPTPPGSELLGAGAEVGTEPQPGSTERSRLHPPRARPPAWIRGSVDTSRCELI